MRVISMPSIQFRCTYCGAVNEGDANEFRKRNTQPPSFIAKCGFCECENVAYPTPLIARAVGQCDTRQMLLDHPNPIMREVGRLLP